MKEILRIQMWGGEEKAKPVGFAFPEAALSYCVDETEARTAIGQKVSFEVSGPRSEWFKAELKELGFAEEPRGMAHPTGTFDYDE